MVFFLCQFIKNMVNKARFSISTRSNKGNILSIFQEVDQILRLFFPVAKIGSWRMWNQIKRIHLLLFFHKDI